MKNGIHRYAASFAIAMGLAGCATPGLVCDMRDNYRVNTSIPKSGSVILTWDYGRELRDRRYGEAFCVDGPPRSCHISMAGAPPAFNDVCGIAKFAHEALHGLGAVHD